MFAPLGVYGCLNCVGCSVDVKKKPPTAATIRILDPLWVSLQSRGRLSIYPYIHQPSQPRHACLSNTAHIVQGKLGEAADPRVISGIGLRWEDLPECSA
jgi:hypothetical protein